jgi:hypothetical protein
MAALLKKNAKHVFITGLILTLFFSVNSIMAADKGKTENGPSYPIKIELQLVEISKEAAEEVGIDLIPENDDEVVTVAKLKKCLENNKEKSSVLSTSRVVVSHGNRAEITSKNTNYVKGTVSRMVQGKEVTGTTYSPYSEGINLSVRAWVLEDDKIAAELSLDYNGIIDSCSEITEQDRPADIIAYSLNEALVFNNDKPFIISGTSYDDSLVYTVVSAEIVKE